MPAMTKLLAGPAAATAIMPKRGLFSRHLLTGTGFAQPNTGPPISAIAPGSATVPTGST